MNAQLLITFSTAFLILLSVFGVVVIVGAMVYDLLQISKTKRLNKVVNKLRKPKQPNVTVLIYSENAALKLVKCIDSVRRSYYKNFQIIVADNASTDETKKVVKLYRQKHPKTPLLFYSKRTPGNRVEVLQRANRKTKPSDLVFVVGASCQVSPKTLKESVAQFYDDPKLEVLRFGYKVISSPSLLIVLQQFLQSSYNQLNKFRSLLPLKTFSLNGANMYTAKTFRFLMKLQNNEDFYRPNTRIKYAYYGNMYATKQTDAKLRSTLLNFPLLAIVLTSKPRSNTKTNSLKDTLTEIVFGTIYLAKVGLILIVTLLIVYFIYTATTLQSNTFLISSWLVVLVWLLAAVWVDEHYGFKEKLSLTFCSPILYFMLPIIIVGMLIKVSIRMLLAVNPNPTAHNTKMPKSQATRLVSAT